jgi:vacuolar protein sorting-associated protein 13A/C
MLESLVANILNRTLGAYVENFDSNQLNIGIWSGDVTLNNLKLKPESLDTLDFPIDLKCGHLGTLTMQIPWSNLKNKPVKILIEDCYLLAAAKLPSTYSAEDEREKQLRIKRQKLTDLEILSQKADTVLANDAENQLKNQSFTDSLVSKIIDNLQITIKNIHIRYEDFGCYTKIPYAFGITLDELSAVSTDENWVANFIQNVSNISRKLLLLKSLTIYMDSSMSHKSMISSDKDEMLVNLREYLISASNDTSGNIEYLLQPVSGKGHLKLNKLGPTDDSPHYDIDLFFEQFRVNLNRLQYTSAIETTAQINYFRKTFEFKKNAPKATIEEEPRQWLQYAFQTVYNEIHNRNYKKTWDYLKARRDQRKAYIPLWKKHLAGSGPLTVEEKKQLQELEDACEYEDLKFYRSLAKLQYKKETKSNPKPATTAAGNKGWFSSWWGEGADKSPSTQSASPDATNESLEITDEQLNEFYDAIEFDESKILTDSLDIPRERVKFSVNCKLNKGSFVIKHKKDNKSNNLAEFISEGCHVEFLQRKDSQLISFKLNKFAVEDGADDTLYKHIVSVKQANTSISADPRSSNLEMEDDPFFQVSFESNPLDESADSELLVKLSSMTIFHNTRFIESIHQFFKPPKAHVDTIGSLMNAAESTIQDFTQQTKIGLQYAFEEHKTMNCKMDLQAPLIILPTDPTKWDAPVGILDAGHISIVSDLISHEKYEQIKNEQKDNYTEKDWERLNTYMYDKYAITLEDAQILIGPDIKSTIEQLHCAGPKNALILDQLDMKFLIELSIIPSFYDLPKMKIGGDIPRFNAMLSDYQYKIFMELLEVSIPDFDGNDGAVLNELDDEDDEDDLEQTFSDAKTFLTGDTGNVDYDNLSTLQESEVEEKNMSASTASLSPHLNQHLVEFNFTIDWITICMKRCSDTTTFDSETLVDIVGEKFRLEMFNTEKKINVDVRLTDISVNDHLETSNVEEFKRLIGSKKHKTSAEGEDLFVVNYTRSLRMATYKSEPIECYDQSVKLDISDFHVVLTRKTLLTLINYSLNTFTDPLAPEIPSDKLRHNDEENVNAPAHIDVNINLKSINLILNDDGIKLATLVLEKADVSLFMLPDSMRVSAKLGGLTLIDNETYNGRKLISIEGDDLADLFYEAYDPETNELPYGSQFKFETGSIVVMVVEDSFTRLYGFMSQFQRMKYIYDTARDAALDQANNVEYPANMKFDVLIRAPIFVIPKAVDPVKNLFNTITVNLGEIHTNNSFTEKDGAVFNIIKAGLTNTKISSKFVVDDEKIQALEIIDKLDVNLDLDYYDGTELDRPSMIINGSLLGNEMKLTEFQAFHLSQLAQSLPRIFKDVPVDSEDIEDIENDATNANLLLMKDKSPEKVFNAIATESTRPSTTAAMGTSESTGSAKNESSPKVSMDFTFDVPVLGLTLYNDTCHEVDISEKKLSQFTLNSLGLKFQSFNNGNYNSDIHIKSFVVKDVRSLSSNVFRDIIPEVQHTEYQFLGKVHCDGLVTTVELAIDSPQIILAMDYLFALKSYADFASHTPKSAVDHYMKDKLANADKINELDDDDVDGTLIDSNVEDVPIINYNINIVDPSVVLLANPEKRDSDAVIFKISQLLFSIGVVSKINVTGIGMFLKKMSLDDASNLRILDDFSFDLTVDTRGCNKTSFLTTIDSDIEPLLLRVSLRDIYLALDIFNKASLMYNQAIGNDTENEKESHAKRHGTSITGEIGKKISKYAPSIISSLSKLSHGRRKSKTDAPMVIVKGERMKINVQGFRLVVIGDVHELPILDFDINAFELTAKNWSTELEADTQISSLTNIFNYSLSQWEPLLEPWSFAIHVEKTAGQKINVSVVSRDTAELTVTSRAIATISHFANLLTEKGELKDRGEDSPYRIINQTGYDLNIWIDDDSMDTTKEKLTVLKDQASIPWSFEDWRAVRESLAIDTNTHYLGIELQDSVYDPIRRLSLRTEGEDTMMLTPVLNNQYHNRLACSITLAEDKVKEVVLKSTVTIENFTPTAIHVGIGNFDGEFVVDREIVIPCGKKFALPIDYVYNGQLAIRPSTTSEIFGWSIAKLLGEETVINMNWENIRDHDLLLECPRIEKQGNADYYYYKAHAEYDKRDALNKLYPHMNILISPPLVIENLLPFEIDWRLFQKGPKKWNDRLGQGEKCPIHVVDMNYSVVMKIEVLGSKYNVSAASIISTPNTMTSVDKEITLKSNDGQRLSLKLFYSADSKYGTKVSIYSPYIFVNRTGKDLYIMDNFNTLVSKKRNTNENAGDEYPDMFSFGIENDAFGIFRGNLETNTIQLKIEDSQPSESFSVDKIGQSFEVRVGLKNRLEHDVGIHITEGQGIYNLTKVIIVTPRYIIKNDMDLPVVIGLNGSSDSMRIEAKSASPVYNFPIIGNKQLQVGLREGTENMSALFAVNNVGEIYLRVRRLDSNAHMLLRVVVSTENASIFINILDAKNLWPYSIRNFSDQEFFVYQANPYVDKDGNEISNQKFQPVFYKIPPKSVMPYAWDFPAAEVKELILRCGMRERYIQLAEIGSLMPMKIKTESGGSKIFDLNVIADGPVQALMISDYNPRTSMYQLKKNNSNASTSKLAKAPAKDEFETTVKDENYYTSIIVKFQGVGISLVNTKEQDREICYTTIKGIEFHYNESDIYQTASLKMKWLQIDNQLYSCIFPVVLFPSIVSNSTYELDSHPVFSTSIARLKDNTHGVNYIKFATMLLQELSLQVDEDFLWALLDFSKVPGAAWNSDTKNELWDKNLEIPLPPTMRSTDDLYFEALHLQPLQFNISFVRTERVNASDTMSTQNALSLATDILTMAIGNINDAPVRLSALFLENIRTPVPYLIQNISEHYTQAFLYQLYKVLGSADVLGNPVGLFNNISSGVMDIFYEPYQGYIMTDRPQELGIGLAKGGVSFLKKSVFGFSDSVSRFSSSMAKGLTAASMDKQFQEKRRLVRHNGGRGNRPADGLSIGAASLFTGISSGITGLATAPIEGATREGTSGFFKGLGKGLLGLPTKTATGVFDFANNISESIKNTTTAFDREGIDKVRLPRFIPFDGAIVPYSKRDAQGQYWLKTVAGGIHADEQYLAHMVLQGGERACIISYSCIMMVKVFEMSVEWYIPLENIINITLEKMGIRFKSKNIREGEKFVVIQDRADRRYLYKQISVAVQNYNRHCIVAL